MTAPVEKIREDVRRYYAEIAEQQPAACCEPADCSCRSGSGRELLAGIPRDVAEFSLGCGDPISAAGLQTGETVLDLGSGGGLDCFIAAKLVGSEGHVIGIDMTDAMLDRATQTAARLGFENVEFRRGLIEELPMEDNSVDAIISNCVINLSPDKPAALREAFRTLRPGGRIVVSDIVTRGEMRPHFREFSNSWESCVAGASPVKDYIEILQSAGFVNIELRPVDDKSLDAIETGIPFSAIITAHKPS